VNTPDPLQQVVFTGQTSSGLCSAAATCSGPSATKIAAGMVGMLVLAGLGWAAVYALRCWLRPFVPCRLCKGQGARLVRRGERPCWWCDGTGARKRWGRRFVDHFRLLRRAGQPRH
jgi:hypothetical protein